MKTNPPVRRASRGMAAALIAGALALAPSPAQAKVTSVDGADHWYDAAAETPAGEVDILSVSFTDEEKDIVYVGIWDENGNEVATHLTYPLKDYLTDEQGSGDPVAVLSVDFGSQLDGKSSYTVKAYDTRSYDSSTTPLFTGTTKVIYGSFDGTVRAIAVSTSDDGSFMPHKTYAYNGATWELASTTPTTDADGRTVYEYQLASDAEDAKGVVHYVNCKTGSLIKDETHELPVDGGRVTIPEVIEQGGTYYRTLILQDTLPLGTNSALEQTVLCIELTEDVAATGAGYRSAKIAYVDESGASLKINNLTDTAALVDKVPVFRRTSYTPPTEVYTVVDGEVHAYVLSEKNTELDQDGVLWLYPEDTTDTHEVVYREKTDEDARIWNVRYVNAAKGTDPSAQIALATCTYTKENGFTWTLNGAPVDVSALPFAVSENADGPSVTITPQTSLTVSGTSYDVVSTQQHDFTHEFALGSADVDLYLYCLPTGDNTALEPYEVTVRYVNVANNSVIDSYTRTSVPNTREDLLIDNIPETFTKGGTEWVRLGGQSSTIRHSYYAGLNNKNQRSYVVYYRDIEDVSNANTVVTTVRTVYDGTVVTVVPAGPAGTTTGGAAAAPAAGGAAQTTAPAATGLGTQGGNAGINAVTGDNGTTVVNNNGTAVETERIDDDANPLAAPDTDEADEAGLGGLFAKLVGPLGALLAALIVALIAFFLRKKRKDDDASSDLED